MTSMRSRGRLVATLLIALMSVLMNALLGVAASGVARGQGLRGLEVVGTEFRLRLSDGSVVPRERLIGATLAFTEADGTSTRLRIDAVEPDARDPEVLLYRLSVPDADGGWRDYCGPDIEGKRLGFPLAGRWDEAGGLVAAAPGAFTIACTSGAIGKCVRFGYKPWKAGPDGAPLDRHHQACIRMVRADYCGDGEPHTRDGTLIDMYDRQGIQKTDYAPDLAFEAGWGVDGATCVRHTRIPELLTLEALGRLCPRLASRFGTACDEDAARRDPATLLFNRSR